ncbi:PH domain-containing protein [uncultured Microbacterium sp.]|uniref:PH domain-containing protein n=1 Tax=uncultured Microbacterium sp. TaxID=191216 RepID=UPI0034142E20
MTTIPEPPRTPGADARMPSPADPGAVPATAGTSSGATDGTSSGALPGHSAPASAPVLDERTYPGLRAPRGEGALALDGEWHQISPKYVVAEVILRILGLVIVGLAAAVVANWSGQSWAWFAGGVIALVLLFELAILPRQARAIGYMLRADDIVFRKGILWQRMIAVPYGRMQLVDITRGPVDRAFGIAKLKLVTAAATTGVDIPGMTEEAAEALRDTLIDVAEMRRTGL